MIPTFRPESNGKLKRFHQSMRVELGEAELKKLGKAREIIGRWMAFYHQTRLHAALQYLPPEGILAGQLRKEAG